MADIFKERYQMITSLLVPFVAIILAVTLGALFIKDIPAFFKRGQTQEQEKFELRVLKEMQLLREEIRFLHTKINELERQIQQKDAKGAAYFFRKVQLEQQQPSTREPPSIHLLQQYVLPAIYIVLGLLLLVSAVVALAARDASRKETAIEMSKTLMTFFIGAATGFGAS